MSECTEPEKPKRKRTEIETVLEKPPVCPRCSSTERERKEAVVTRNFKGRTADGRLFNRIKWSRCRCQSCGARYKVITHEFVPEAGKRRG